MQRLHSRRSSRARSSGRSCRAIVLRARSVLDAQALRALVAQALRALVATVLERKVDPRGQVNFVRTVLRAAVESGALAAMRSFPPSARQGRKLPDAPSDEEVHVMLAHAHGWLRAAIALGAFAGMRSGEVRALLVRASLAVA